MAVESGAPADWPEDVPWYKWPPFPAKPDGVTIIPFSQFVATGLPTDQDEDAPGVDQMGVPTIALEVRHDGEKKRRKKKKGPNGEVMEVPPAWWEEIEEDAKSSRRVYKYNENEPYLDRLTQAFKDFTEKRRFPSHVLTVAQNLSACLGLAEPNPHPNGVKTNKDEGSNEAVSDDESEDEQETGDAGNPPQAIIEEVYGGESKTAAEIEREQALDAFYQDPERAIKIFLTSYAYDKGVYWNELKLQDTPILVEAFLNFLEVNSVLGSSEKSVKHGIAQAKRVAELAKQEMPHANVVARLFPDGWGKACGEIWGQSTTGGWVFGRLPEEPQPAIAETTDADMVDQSASTNPNGTIDPDMIITPTDAELQADSVEPPSINGKQTEWSDGGWGVSNAWGPGSGADAPWSGEAGAEGDTPAWISDEFKEPPPPDPAIVWGNFGPSGREQLEALIGPNNLPETYVTLRVESSSRVIGPIVEPTPNPAGIPQGASFADVAQQRLARLTMLPSPYSKTAPRLGSCVNQPEMLNPPIDEEQFGWVGPHDPLTDNITLFVQSDEHFLEVLRTAVGMTVTGLFVQVAELAPPKEDEVQEAQLVGGEPPKKKKKKKGKKDATANVRSWWFFCQMGQVYPTFFTQ